ncbi:MAG: hypothetical protein IJY10_05420 [Lachnospiraceae bacterium]|nr:hypothetical protein [Lachnospiraceae bacterium]
MKLARLFTDYIVLQREMPVLIWGTAEKDEKVEVKLNGEVIREIDVKKGAVQFTIPAQPAMENATLEIGDNLLSHVDFGEVWIAGGQSNMEFALRFTQEWKEEQQCRNDEHFRMYTVGQYSYAGQREEGYKAWNPWDKWLPYTENNGAEFSAVATFFAKQLREEGVPVGIISCNWGGTSASAWLDKKILLEDPDLKTYLDDYDELVASLNMFFYKGMKKNMRKMMASEKGMEGMSGMMLNTVSPDEMKGKAGMPPLPPFLTKRKVAPDKLMMWGPGDQNEPGTLFDNMVSEIVGVSSRGVIWYQGESDCFKDKVYGKLFTAVINCWREAWKKTNPAMEKLPFLFVQLAPYGVWMMNPAEDYTVLREQQEQVSKTVPDTYMTTIGDLGNVYDIHPKVKKPVGKRLAGLALKYVYGKNDILADAPEFVSAKRENEVVTIEFAYANGLYKKEEEYTSYNGFSLDRIRPELLPKITDGVNALEVLVNGEVAEDVSVSIDNENLVLKCDSFVKATEICVKYAKTGFYQLNLFNKADIPVKPFAVTIK